MAQLDDAVPGGNIAKPLLIALGALLVGRMFANKAAEKGEATPAPDKPEEADGGILGGLGGLLEKLQNSGQGQTADSWVKPGPNAPIQPEQLGPAIGNQTLSQIAKQAGVSEQELLKQLSDVLPGLVDKMTPDGRIPNNREIAALFSESMATPR